MNKPTCTWDINTILDYRKNIDNHTDKVIINNIFDRYQHTILPQLSSLNIINENNFDCKRLYQLTSLLVDKLPKANELYFSAKDIIVEFCETQPITEFEADMLFDIMTMQLAEVIVTRKENADVQQLSVQCLKKLAELDRYFMRTVVRNAAGYLATREYDNIIGWLKSADCTPKPLFKKNLHTENSIILFFDHSEEHLQLIPDVNAHQQYVENLLKKHDAAYAIGLYGEDRGCYQAPMFQSIGCLEKRSIHMGLDIFIDAETALYSPLKAKVFSLQYNGDALDYGHTVILEHVAGENGSKFYTLYGHLSKRTFTILSEGDEIEAGTLIGFIGNNNENGGWCPHLHFQIMTSMLSCVGNFYGVCEPSMWQLWQQICPDPNILLQLKFR